MTRSTLMLALGLLITSPAALSDFDGSEPLLCTLMIGNICDYDGCDRAGRNADLGGVRHLVVDFERDRVKSPETDLQAPIRGVQRVDNMLFIGGVNDNADAEADARSWTMAIANPTGTMSLAVTGEEVAMTVFGACTPIDD